jgi:hypothetical protein
MPSLLLIQVTWKKFICFAYIEIRNINSDVDALKCIM